MIEVHNTYGERHAYVLEAHADENADEEVEVGKVMYVSPFNGIDGTYRISVDAPGSTVGISVRLERRGEEPFVATLHGRRQPITPKSVIGSALRHSGRPHAAADPVAGARAVGSWAEGATEMTSSLDIGT